MFTDITLKSINSFGNSESISHILSQIGKHQQTIQNQAIFIDPSFSKFIPLTRNQLYLMCAYSGHGKSTIAANMCLSFWKQGKKVLMISNEESAEDILLRIACLDLGISFNSLKKQGIEEEEFKKIEGILPLISEFIKIKDISDTVNTNGRLLSVTKTVEGVSYLLQTIADSDFDCVVIDYFQNIDQSIHGHSNKQLIMNDLMIELERFMKCTSTPIVLFAQLHSIGKRGNKELDARLKDCPRAIHSASVVIEICPNVAEGVTDFLIHKDRYGLQRKRIRMTFENGKLKPWSK